jgi:hypothetical protein
VKFFTVFVPIALHAGMAVMLGHLAINMCMWNYFTKFIFFFLGGGLNYIVDSFYPISFGEKFAAGFYGIRRRREGE